MSYADANVGVAGFVPGRLADGVALRDKPVLLVRRHVEDVGWVDGLDGNVGKSGGGYRRLEQVLKKLSSGLEKKKKGESRGKRCSYNLAGDPARCQNHSMVANFDVILRKCIAAMPSIPLRKASQWPAKKPRRASSPQ